MGVLERIPAEVVPMLEFAVVGSIADVVRSSEFAAAGDPEEQALAILSTCQSAVTALGRGAALPMNTTRSPEIQAAREQVARGANALGAQGERGFRMLVLRLMPAAIDQVRRQAGDPDALTFWSAYYFLLALASGSSNTPPDEPTAAGIMQALREIG